MKRLLLIPLLFLCLTGFGQKYKSYWDSIPVPTGTDTSIYINFQTVSPWSISFDYKAFDDTDATLDLGECPAKKRPRALFDDTYADSTIFNRLANSSLPVTLSDSTVAFEKSSFPHEFLVIKLTKGSVTAGKYLYYCIIRGKK